MLNENSGPCESVTLEWNFLVNCLNSLELIAVNEQGGRRKVPRTGSCASASLQRVKGFPVAAKERSERAQCQAKKDGKDRGEGRECYVWQNDVEASVYKAWQISPICRLLFEGVFMLDGTKRFHDKSQGRTVLRDAKRVGPPELRRNIGKCENV